jgi:hypothetical protein
MWCVTGIAPYVLTFGARTCACCFGTAADVGWILVPGPVSRLVSTRRASVPAPLAPLSEL